MRSEASGLEVMCRGIGLNESNVTKAGLLAGIRVGGRGESKRPKGNRNE